MTSLLRRAAVPPVLAGLLLALAVPAFAAQPARSVEDDLPRVVVAVEDLTGVVAPGDELRVRLRVRSRTRSTTEDLRVIASLHRRTRSRFDYQQAVDTGAVGARIGGTVAGIDSLPGEASRVVQLSAEPGEAGLGASAEPGVYPLRVRLEQRGRLLDEVVTSVVLVPPAVEEPVAAAFLLPVDHEPGLRPDGSYDARFLQSLAVGGRLRRLVDLAADRAAFPVTLVVNPLVLDHARDIADGFRLAGDAQPDELPPDSPQAQVAVRFLDRLRAAANRPEVQLVALPYGPADLVALVEGGMTPEAVRHITSGLLATAEITGTQPVADVLVPPDALSTRALTEAVVPAGIDTLLLSERWLTPPEDRDLSFTPSPVRRVRSGTSQRLTALVPDPWLEDTLAEGPEGGAAVAAQRILAETASLYYERPFARDPRGVLLAPPLLWTPPPGTAEALLQGMRDAPWLRPVGLQALLATIAPAEGRVRLSYPSDAREQQLPEDYVGALAAARESLASLSNVLTPEDEATLRYDALLRAASSVHFRSRTLRDHGRALIRAVSEAVANLYASVEVADNLPITLTGREGQIPVTIRNRAPVPLAVTVTLSTPRYAFANGGQRTLEVPAGDTVTVGFRAQVLAPGGTYPIRVQVTDPAGVRQLATGSLVVRSTAASPVALVITAGSSAFLLGWWLREVRSRRRARSARAPASARRAA